MKDSLRNLANPLLSLYDLGLFGVPTVAAHCVHVDDDDIEILKNMNVSPVNNPSSNLKLASGFAPVAEMLEREYQ